MCSIGETLTLGSKAACICIPTTSGTGAEVTPFAVIRDQLTGRKLTLASLRATWLAMALQNTTLPRLKVCQQPARPS
jgi:alcohol dehydrogenase class IV